MFGNNRDFPGFDMFPDGMEWGFEGHIGGQKNAEVIEYEDEYRVVFELPGFQEDEISVRMSEDEQTISVDAEGNDENYEGGEGVTSRTVRRKKISKSVKLPDDADMVEEEVDAEYNNGLLTIKVGRVENIEEKEGLEIDIE